MFGCLLFVLCVVTKNVCCLFVVCFCLLFVGLEEKEDEEDEEEEGREEGGEEHALRQRNQGPNLKRVGKYPGRAPV